MNKKHFIAIKIIAILMLNEELVLSEISNTSIFLTFCEHM